MSVDGASAWPQWSRVDERGLARFVTAASSRWLPLEISRFDVGDRPDRHLVICQAIYDALVAREIRYDLEEYHPSAALQTIRTPAEVLEAPRVGTCLDLAALFCGLCLAYELLPIVIVVDGHALAAVSTVDGLRAWNANRAGRELFAEGQLTNAQGLRELVDSGTFIAVECTGFAHTDRLEGRQGGVLDFEHALEAGRQQLERPLRFALDVAVAHYGWRIEPHPLQPTPGASVNNIFRLLTAAAAPLAAHLHVLDFELLVEDRTANFVGRDFIFEAIDAKLADDGFRSGYILIRGEPGIGKTALLSQLVKTRGYVHHFNIALQNIRSTRTFLTNVCAQLIVRYQLDHTVLPPEATDNSAYLGRLLREAVAKTLGEPVIVLVDALDEAEDTDLAPEANRLYLPEKLPEGVFFILTSREQIDYRLVVDRREDLYLRDDDPQNLADVRAYVRRFVSAHPEMEERIAAWEVDRDRFVELITGNSEGNFMYLVHVLEDIRSKTLSKETIDRIEDLPTGLRAYYERHWLTMRTKERQRFETIYEPVLRLLATVREPVSVAAVEEWTKLDPARVRDVIREWRPFLNEHPGTNGEKLYRVYHASFQEFLAEEGVGLKPSHERIAETALLKIPGFFPQS